MGKKKTEGDAILTCRNHPNLRWTKTKYTLSGPRGFIGDGILMFNGVVNGKRANAIRVLTESSLAECSPEYQVHYREHWAVECDCPVRDLVFLEWCDENVPASKAEADAIIEGLGARMIADARGLGEVAEGGEA